jgi:hypothetical protein
MQTVGKARDKGLLSSTKGTRKVCKGRQWRNTYVLQDLNISHPLIMHGHYLDLDSNKL